MGIHTEVSICLDREWEWASGDSERGVIRDERVKGGRQRDGEEARIRGESSKPHLCGNGLRKSVTL